MNCPVCKNAMIVLELEQVEVDHCPSCGGIWLDGGELELLLGESEKAKHLLASFKTGVKCKEAARKCPICDRKMQKIIIGNDNQCLLIDKCPKHHGLWFDKGELQDIFLRGQLDREGKILKLLADMFGKNYLEGEKI